MTARPVPSSADVIADVTVTSLQLYDQRWWNDDWATPQYRPNRSLIRYCPSAVLPRTFVSRDQKHSPTALFSPRSTPNARRGVWRTRCTS